MLVRAAGRVALWQLAIVWALAGAALAGPWAAAGAGLLAPTAVRVRGRWLDQWVLAYLRFRRRTRRRRARSPLDALVPGLTTRTFTDRAGNRVELATDGATWSAVLRVEPAAGAESILLDRVA